ncbi:MAG: hypothetical protein ACK5UA_12330 [Cereibacter sp.]
MTVQEMAALRPAGFAQLVQAIVRDRTDDSARHRCLAVFARHLPPAG